MEDLETIFGSHVPHRTRILLIDCEIVGIYLQYFTNWIEKSFSFIPISKYFSVKCLKSEWG